MGTARLSNQNQAVQNFLNRRGDADRIVNSLRYIGKILSLSLFFLTGSSAYAAGHRAPSITGVASFVLLSGASAEGAVSFSAVPIAPVSFYLSPASQMVQRSTSSLPDPLHFPHCDVGGQAKVPFPKHGEHRVAAASHAQDYVLTARLGCRGLGPPQEEKDCSDRAGQDHLSEPSSTNPEMIIPKTDHEDAHGAASDDAAVAGLQVVTSRGSRHFYRGREGRRCSRPS